MSRIFLFHQYSLIQKIALECRMPLCIGGGIKSVEQAIKIIELGVEKIALSSAIVENTSLITSISNFKAIFFDFSMLLTLSLCTKYGLKLMSLVHDL